jgi:dolichyl-phosphate-mannose-protein mannosyltransferase
VPSGDAKFYKSPFLRDFWHLNVAMMTSNNALIPDPDKEDILASSPTDWPWMRLGLRMCGWGDDQTKYYLLGTPVIWWGGTASLIVSVIVFCVYLLRHQRKYIDMTPRKLTCQSSRKHALIHGFRTMGSFLVCWKDCWLWMVLALL